MSRRLHIPAGLPAWTPFQFARGRAKTSEELMAIAEHAGVTPEAVKAMADRLENESVVVMNSRYTVHVMRVVVHGGHMIHLSIRRNDRKRPGPERWRDFQRIKNELCGTKAEAAELYPDEERLIDGADQFHLWVLPWGMRFPFGFVEGRQVSYESAPSTAQTPAED